MPPVMRKRNPSQAINAKQSGGKEPKERLAGRKRAPATPKASKVVKPRRGGADALEGDTDERELVPLTMNATKGIKETKMEMRRKAGEVTKLMKTQLMKETLGSGVQAFTETFPADAVSVLHQGSPRNNDNTTFQKAQECLANLQDLVKGYEGLNKASTSVQTPTRAHWDQDEADLRALNESLLGGAFRILNSIVMPDACGDPVEDLPRAVGSSDIDLLAVELLAGARPQREDVTWGMAARDLFRSLSGAVELLLGAKPGL